MADTAPAKTGNVFTNKIGPLPMWGWVAIVGGVIIVWALYENHKNSTAAATSSTSATSAAVPPVIDQFQVNTGTASPAATTTTPAATTTPPTAAVPPVNTVTLPISKPPGVANTNQEPSYWTQAITALKAKGVKNPSSKQINAERNAIRKSVGLGPLTLSNKAG